MSFLLNRASLIICPHGGMVLSSLIYGSKYLVDGQPVCVKEDSYLIYGCPMKENQCRTVKWLDDSSAPLLYGRFQALTNTSVGLCLDFSKSPTGNAIIHICQTKVSLEDFKSR
jgi:hypothetical protein